MVRTFYKHYFYPMDEHGTFAECDTSSGVPLVHLIGNTLADLMCNANCPLEFVRLNHGGGNKVSAFRRIADIKVTVEFLKHYE